MTPPLSIPLSIPLRHILLLSVVLSALLYLFLFSSPPFASTPTPPFPTPPTPTALSHLIFGIASSSRSYSRRLPYLRLWWRPGVTRGIVFLDSSLPDHFNDPSLPRIRVSSPDSSRFPYSFPGGLRSAVRVARIAKELVDAFDDDTAAGEVRWIVLGDDDTVFFLDNLVSVLRKYDWRRWYYVGGRSESVEQNLKHSFDMAFGGAGFAISYPLAKVLARVMDSCLMRYGHMYGSDARVFACLAELGVGLTYEAGFHQIDVRGDLSGLLLSHPLTPLLSLHHLDLVDPLFPGMNRTEALRHLFKAVMVDPGRVLQQTVCYDRVNVRSISISWGYAAQVFEGNQLLPNLLTRQQTFRSWSRSRKASSPGHFMFNTREVPKDPCQRPAVFFFESAWWNKSMANSNYNRHEDENCQEIGPTKNLQTIRLSSKNLDFEAEQVPRRQCCDTLPSSSNKVMDIQIRRCEDDELIAMVS